MPDSFASNFWDVDFNGTEGYDRVILRLKDGKKLYDAFSEFVRNRAKLEDEYGRKLMNLAQTAGNEETGSLRTSWEAVKKETENIGIIHCQLGKELNELSDKISKHRENQKQERIKIDEQMRKEQKEKKASFDSMMKARRLYDQRCKDYDTAKDAFEGKYSYTPKEEDKLKKNMQKSKTVAENSDSSYMSSVKILEELHKKYIVNMVEACNKFQKIEEGRISFLRNEMWLYTNLGSTHIVNIDQKYEHCRTILEKCNVKYDIQLFVSSKHTESTRPTPIEYVNYYNTSKVPTDWSTNIETSRAGITEKSSSHPNLLSNNGGHEQLAGNPSRLGYSGPQMHSSNPNLLIHHNTNLDEEPYTTVSASMYIPPTTGITPKRARAAYAYQAQSARELSLNPGDLIEVKYIVDDTWGMGILDGKTGAFPLTFVEIIQ